MSIQWDDSGLRELQADLEDSGDRVGKETADVLRKHGKVMQGIAESISPVRTGDLKRGWEIEGSGDGRSAGMSVSIRNKTRQAFFQEHGTSFHPPQPSAGPALEHAAPGFIADMEKVGSEVLE